MEIQRREQDGYLELFFEGRLDGYWAQHLATSVGEVMHEGKHSVRLNLSKAAYISSAGISVLVQMYQQFAAVQGSFAISEPSAPVKKVLELVGLSNLLAGAKTAPSAGAKAAAAAEPAFERREAGGAIFEMHRLRDAEMTCAVVGDPSRLTTAGYSAADCRDLQLTDTRLAIGLGGFGDNFATCQDRFGEFLAVAGAAACQPTDGTNYPDYMSSSGTFVPHVSTLYGLCCEGGFSRLVRFETAGIPAAFSLTVQTCLEFAGVETAAVVMLAESSGLMGAALKQPPVRKQGKDERVFGFPDIRRWLDFSPEHCFPRSVALAVGVASLKPPEKLRPLVRPLAKGSAAAGHFHAAAFGYKPLQKGKIDMRATVRGLFEAGGLEGVLHLLADDRNIAGGGESELLRGACWIAPIREIGTWEDAQ